MYEGETGICECLLLGNFTPPTKNPNIVGVSHDKRSYFYQFFPSFRDFQHEKESIKPRLVL